MIMKLFSETARVLSTILKERYYQKAALLGAVAFAAMDYWFFSRVTTWSMFFEHAADGEYGRFSMAYAAVFAVTTAASIIFFGISSALLLWQFKHSAFGRAKSAGLNGLGAFFGAFGAACPVCGAFLLQLLGVTSGVAALPLLGLEFKFLTLGIIGAATVYSATRAAPVLDGKCEECVPSAAKAQTEFPRPRFISAGAEKLMATFIVIALAANQLLISQVAVAFGLVPAGGQGVGRFIGTLVGIQSASARSIVSTKMNPDGRTTTLATWPTITEVPAEPIGMETVEAARVVMVPAGTPFYAPEGISFDDPVAALAGWQKYEKSIQLTGELEARWQKIIGSMTCDYCCGGPTNVTVINRCGCAHAQAFRSISKYLLANYGDKYSDDEIIGELQRWKGAWYPRGVIEDYLLATGRGDALGHKTHGGAGTDGKHGF